MRILIQLLALVLITPLTMAQIGWKNVSIGKGLSIGFPNTPNSDKRPEKGLAIYSTTSNTSDCLFTVLVRENAISKYDSINKLPLSKREAVINDILDQGIVEFIGNSKIESPTMHFKVGDYYGKEMTYSRYDDTKKRWVTNYTKFILADNDAYIIQCSVYKKGDCIEDKNTFLNSITTN